MPYLTVGDAELSYTVTGSGPPLVLVHGWTCDSSDWSWLIPLLQDQFRVIAYDRRGNGRSLPSGGFELPQDVADLAEVIERVADGPAVVVGHSVGAAIVSLLAVQRPELVLGAVSIDPPYPVIDQRRDFIEGMRARLLDGDPERVVRSFFAALTPDWIRPFILRRVLTHSAEALRTGFTALWREEIPLAYLPGAHDYLAQRKCPVLVLYTEAAVHAGQEERTFRHPASRAKLLTGSGHWLQIERPDEVAAEVRQWWSAAREID
jgi:pimeloyl-ACP methyl ester carboxylesterase